MKTHASVYNESKKQEWREHIFNMLIPENCHSLVDEEGNLKYKWLEPIGTGAVPFKHLLGTGKIKEEQLIGVDLDPADKLASIKNVEACKLIYPKAEILAQDWKDFCYNYNGEDIGYVILDLYLGQGSNYEEFFDATLELLERCKRKNGEVFFVSNTDLGADRRHGKGTPEQLAEFISNQFQKSKIREFRELKINKDNIYIYTSKKTPMATFAMML